MLEIRNVTKSFANVTALKNLSFELRKGQTLGLIGQNGAGKSTTFKMILNFLKPDQGDIKFESHTLSNHDLNQIGYMPEERGLYLDMTIQQQVVYFAELHSYSKKDALKELPYWLDRLAVKGDKKSKLKSLSKGNQQKVQLIASFIHKPKLLILDEPFSGLDPINTEILITTIQELKEQGTAIIFSSHDMRNVERLSDNLILLVNGNPVLQGNLNSIKSSFGKTNLYIEGVYTSAEIKNLNGFLSYENDYPGYKIIFNNENNARQALKKAQTASKLAGYRLFNPSMDEIFKNVIEKGDGEVNE